MNSADSNLNRIYNNPTFRRMYFRALQELVNGPLNVTQSGPLIDAKYAAFVANGLSVQSPLTIKSWLTSARNAIAQQIATARFSVTDSGTVSNNFAYITGTAPVNIKTICFNGVEWPVVWKSVTTWMATVPLKPGNNSFSVVGVDLHGRPLTGATNVINVAYAGPASSPVGQVVINEIMYHPNIPGAQYIELHNNSTDQGFDLSGWQMPDLAYTFPDGSVIAPGAYLVLAENRAAFAGGYGATNPVFDTYSQLLPVGSGSLSLLAPAADAVGKEVVAQVHYDNALPWPTGADGLGSSLQLIDPVQDNWRVANWAGSYPPLSLSPGAPNTVLSSLPPFPSLWLNELQADNLTGITNSLGQRTAWLELYNPGTNQLSLAGLFLANDYTNLTAWPFPNGAVINPGEFKVIFADGQINLSVPNELHTSFTLTSGSGQVALSQLDTNSEPQVLDYLTYTDLLPNHSYGSVPDGQSFKRREMVRATPGATNSPGGTLTVVINEWMAGNTTTIRDPVTGKFDDWFELYNYGPSAVDLAGCYLSHSLTNLFEFRIPAGYILSPHGFLLVWADKKVTNTTPDLHVNFKLSKSGASIGLFDTNGIPIDTVSFGPQTSDISMGRYPDGGPGIFILPTASPRATNSAPNTAPLVSSPGDRFVYLGQTLSFIVQASDSDLPPQILNYSLEPGAPANATLDPANGHFVWTPAPNQAPSTNWFAVRVTDNGTPPLTQRRLFTVTVGLPPQLGVASLSGNQITFGWPAARGQTYQIEFKEALNDDAWTPLGSPLVGSNDFLTFSDNLLPAVSRYFRLRILP